MEQLLYTRLSTDGDITALVGSKIYPSFPSVDTKLPYIVYTRLDTEAQTHLGGNSNLSRYEFVVEYWSINADTSKDLGDKVMARLNLWREGEVQGCFLTSRSQEREELGFHGMQTYTIFSA